METSMVGLIALTALRVGAGGFFALSGGNKLVRPDRHATLVRTLQEDKVPFVGFMQWWVPSWELVGGTCLALGLGTWFMASVLAIVCIVACLCEGKKRVASYQPINAADRVDDWLYLPEVLYGLVLVFFAAVGGGAWSLDALLRG